MKTFSEFQSDNELLGDIDDITEKFLEDVDTVINEMDDLEYNLNAKAINESEAAQKAYKVYKDKDENFECNISVEGAGIDTTKVRLILNTDIWNIIFEGKLYADGTCVVPLKRGIPFPVGTTGKICLEVIVDDQLFIGWEDYFIVEASKKVKVELKEQKTVKVVFNGTR